jgi:hypothetical protein
MHEPSLQPQLLTPAEARRLGPLPREQIEDGRLPSGSMIPALDNSLRFIEQLRKTTRLEDTGLDEDLIHRLRNPPHAPPAITIDEQLSIDLFLAITDGSQKMYELACDAVMRRHPEDCLLSYHLVKKKITELTGVYAIAQDMCPNSCMAYTGPYSILESCPHCGHPRFNMVDNKSRAHQQFSTFPVGPQLQARYCTTDGAHAMRYRESLMQGILDELAVRPFLEKIEDLYHGSVFYDAYQRGHIGADDIVLLFSMDGAQLFEYKASNCWIYIWVIADMAPERRYKKKSIILGGIAPGPNKPKEPDSFLFVGLQHVVALQKEGLPIWDGDRGCLIQSHLYVLLSEADAVGAPELTGYVGHNGKRGCRVRCKFIGRHKPNHPHYYAVALKPHNYVVDGCTHEDIVQNLPRQTEEEYLQDLHTILNSRHITDYEANRLQTGLSKPSIFLGISRAHRSDIPDLFCGDIMHAFGLNITDLMVKLLHGTMACDEQDDKSFWK